MFGTTSLLAAKTEYRLAEIQRQEELAARRRERGDNNGIEMRPLTARVLAIAEEPIRTKTHSDDDHGAPSLP